MSNKIIKTIWLLCSLLFTKAMAQMPTAVQFADPTIFYHNNTYYLYGTGETHGGGGFEVFTSTDLSHWKDEGRALKMGDAFGTKGFWAPQVFEFKGKFYMAYVANEHIAIAESVSPLGPFTQKVKKPITAPFRMIDPFILFDGGKAYLYHVRLDRGNRIYVAEMDSDLSGIKEQTAKACINATQPWENTQKVDWSVTEGPTVIKRNGLYYLFYSANDYRNIDYAVGYATSKSPWGPWKKYENNPILSRVQTGVNGTGHGDFFVDKEKNLRYVFHTHESNEGVGRRKTALVSAKFIINNAGPDVLKIDSTSFKNLFK